MERHVKIGNMEYTYKYPRPAVTADCVVIANEKTPKVLLIQRGKEPYKDRWAFPGGFMNMDETTEVCAFRELMEETGLKVEDLKEIGAYSKVDRDPRGRTITVAYLAIVDKATKVKGQDDAAEAEWFAVDSLPPLAFFKIWQDEVRRFTYIRGLVVSFFSISAFQSLVQGRGIRRLTFFMPLRKDKVLRKRYLPRIMLA